MTRPFKPFVFYPKKRSRRVDSLETADAIVRARYPRAFRNGSVGLWHWRILDPQFPCGIIVAEAIAANQGTDLFLRIR